MPDQTNSSLPRANPSSSGTDQSEDKETEQIIEPPYEPPALFPNRLKPKKHSADGEDSRNLQASESECSTS